MKKSGRTACAGFLATLAIVAGLGSASLGQVSAVDARGRAIDPLSSGKPVVLLFLSTDCPITNRYAPTIQELAKKYEGRAAFWLIYPGTQDSPQAIAARLHDYGYELPWLRDPDRVLVAKAQATITPEAAVFDRNGELQYHGRIDDLYVSISQSRRAATQHDLDDALHAVLSGTPVKNHALPAVGCYIVDMR